MVSPLRLKDVEEMIPVIFRSRDEGYDEIEPRRESPRDVPKITKEELELIVDAIMYEERGYVEYQLLNEDIHEIAQKIYNFSKNDAILNLKGKVYVGIDGSSARILREQLAFLIARGVGYFYSFLSIPLNVTKRYYEIFSRAFLIFDSNILKDRGEAEDIDMEAIKQDRIMIKDLSDAVVISNSDNEREREELLDSSGKALGYEVRLRHLTELATIDNIVSMVESGMLNISEDNLIILVDGPLFPTSTRPEEYTHVIERATELDIPVISIVKRISYGKLFKTLLESASETQQKVFLKILYKTENSEFLKRQFYDGTLVHKALGPNQRTFFFRYKLKGRMTKRDYRIPKKYLPVACYIKTGTGRIYRIEVPYIYYKKGGIEKLEEFIKIVFSLIKENSNIIPRPIELAHMNAKISKNEKLEYSRWLDKVFWNKLGIRLYPPYEEEYGGELLV
ncbi:DNA double-strand break repair nuclease NurA [Pyrococcus kukulkanii]|uniref:DNA double-strand break repair nuclease NurA n=1 Tax=Pyrococcus kukulkanii TaxID=1609559 RepID=UPI0035646F8E